MRARVREDEEERLAALRAYDVLDTPPERPFDELAAQAAELVGAPVALVTLVDRDRQWFKARIGFEPQETDLGRSFCAHAILQQEPLVVPDAEADQRFADNPLVTGPTGLRSYAGAQIRTPAGLPLGTVCVLDRQPMELSDTQLATLQLLGEEAASLLRLRKEMRTLAGLADDEDRAAAAVAEAERILADAQRKRGELLFHLTDRFHATFTVDSVQPGRVQATCLCGWRSPLTINAGIAGALWDDHRRASR